MEVDDLSTKAKDLWTRVWRTFAQAALPIFLVTAVGPLRDVWYDLLDWAAGNGGRIQEPHVDALRAALVTVISAGIVAVVALLWNWLNDYLRIGNGSRLTGKPVDTAVGDQVLNE